MKLHRDLGVRQATAWFMLHRIREAYSDVAAKFSGPVEVESDFTLEAGNRTLHEKDRLLAGPGPLPKVAVVGAKDRETNQVVARVIHQTDQETLRTFSTSGLLPLRTRKLMVYADGSSAYKGRRRHEAVYHSGGEYVRCGIHTNGVESFWSMLKRCPQGRLAEALGQAPAPLRPRSSPAATTSCKLDTLAKMQHVVAAMVGKSEFSTRTLYA